jgi:RimJ/RimL family protein N-acetyltransferase
LRLTYEPVDPGQAEAFHGLVQDEHVRRYLLDGQVMAREWTEGQIADSGALFARRGVGMWLAREAASGEVVGFCGFLVIPSIQPEPQLVYALLERFTGRGYATEMGQACIREARANDGFAVIHASVDAVNVASVRVLEKLGFQRTGTEPGAFGEMYRLQLPPG